MNLRIERLIDLLLKENLSGLLINHPANIQYLSDYRGQESYLIISAKHTVFLTDFRYIEEAKTALKGIEVRQITEAHFESLSGVIKDLGLKRLGFEAEYTSVLEHKKLKSLLAKGVELIPTTDLVEKLRLVKDSSEVKKIRSAIELTGKALKFFNSILKPGVKEIDLAAELGRFIKKNGGLAEAFPIIIASGKNSSYPHAALTHKPIKRGEPVMVDLGVDFLGYKSDLTRIFFLDKISPRIRSIYDVVREAQERAFKRIKPGSPISQIDKAAREYIVQKGYGKFFGHSLGHGIGLEVHEGPPISSRNNDCIIPGMVFTIEPAIYLPGKFGIRIEDDVLVTEKGAKILSDSINK
ncbi:MAG: Xaa-Pro peptidase family protein [Candidatus Omnitrophota bacterium]